VIFQRGIFFKVWDFCEEVTMMKRIMNKVVYFLTNKERGATAVEYALMVALIAAVIIAAVTLLGTNINTIFTNIAARFNGVGT
jgi:pilus assembly protein Flp/PilA